MHVRLSNQNIISSLSSLLFRLKIFFSFLLFINRSSSYLCNIPLFFLFRIPCFLRYLCRLFITSFSIFPSTFLIFSMSFSSCPLSSLSSLLFFLLSLLSLILFCFPHDFIISSLHSSSSYTNLPRLTLQYFTFPFLLVPIFFYASLWPFCHFFELSYFPFDHFTSSIYTSVCTYHPLPLTYLRGFEIPLLSYFLLYLFVFAIC